MYKRQRLVHPHSALLHRVVHIPLVLGVAPLLPLVPGVLEETERHVERREQDDRVVAVSYTHLDVYKRQLISVPGSLLRSHVNTGVVVQPRGQLTPLSIVRLPSGRDPCPNSQDICNVLNEGASVKTQREAGYGPVASLVLPDKSHIQLWASPNGADLTLTRYQVTQWNNQQQIVQLVQHAGYVRYDIAKGQAYKQIVYEVQTDSGTRIRLSLIHI